MFKWGLPELEHLSEVRTGNAMTLLIGCNDDVAIQAPAQVLTPPMSDSLGRSSTVSLRPVGQIVIPAPAYRLLLDFLKCDRSFCNYVPWLNHFTCHVSVSPAPRTPYHALVSLPPGDSQILTTGLGEPRARESNLRAVPSR